MSKFILKESCSSVGSEGSLFRSAKPRRALRDRNTLQHPPKTTYGKRKRVQTSLIPKKNGVNSSKESSGAYNYVFKFYSVSR